jgi:hypothetical protein
LGVQYVINHIHKEFDNSAGIGNALEEKSEGDFDASKLKLRFNEDRY